VYQSLILELSSASEIVPALNPPPSCPFSSSSSLFLLTLFVIQIKDLKLSYFDLFLSHFVR
jgi:hypothetical protein